MIFQERLKPGFKLLHDSAFHSLEFPFAYGFRKKRIQQIKTYPGFRSVIVQHDAVLHHVLSTIHLIHIQPGEGLYVRTFSSA